MKRNFNYIIGFLLVFFNSIAQKNDIELIQEVKNDTIKIYLKNNLSENANVNLTITGSGYKKFVNPITNLIQSNETLEFVSLIPISKKGISYKAAISYKTIKSIKEEQVLVKGENQNNSNDLNELNGIIVFSKKGCSRSKKTIDYLNDKKIKHIELDITSNKENYELMWEKLNLKTPTNITFPVIIVNNKPSHSHKDLDLFLKNIK